MLVDDTTLSVPEPKFLTSTVPPASIVAGYVRSTNPGDCSMYIPFCTAFVSLDITPPVAPDTPKSPALGKSICSPISLFRLLPNH
jgi:hypothetical protein